MKFLADRMLGRLAKNLRMLGYDTLYFRGDDPEQMVRLADREGRIILTRQKKVLAGAEEERILQVNEDAPSLQLKDLIRRGYVSFRPEHLFSRCLACNEALREISREEARGKVPDFVFYHQKTFYQCPGCRRIYWAGSHLEKMRTRVEALFQLS